MSREKTSSKTPSEPAAAEPADRRLAGLRLFSDAQLEQIHLASLEILRRTGVRVSESEAVAMLREVGCTIRDGDLVRFPAAAVEEALQHVPSRIVLCDRGGRPHVYLEDERCYFGTGSDLPNTLDLETGQRRPSLLQDVADTARLVDALPNLDFAMSMALPSDVPKATADRYAFLAMVENTAKPIVFTAWDESGLADIVAMAEIIAGEGVDLALNPFLLAYLEPTSPLQHSGPALRKLFLLADRGLPFVYAPGPLEGASAPMTPAGSLAMANAEVLSGLVIAQLRRRGTPFVWGSGSGPLDMRTMVGTYAAPEFMLHCLGMAELAHHYYHVPVWGFAGCSDAKGAGMQAGIESALWILWAALSGANLIHDVGYVESGLTCSYEMIVVGDEIIGFVRRLLAGVELSAEALALEVIDQVGPGGTFLSTAHTRRHFRESWMPGLLDRQAHHAWTATGRPTLDQRARETARQILATHTPPPLPARTMEAMRTIVAGADARAAASSE